MWYERYPIAQMKVYIIDKNGNFFVRSGKAPYLSHWSATPEPSAPNDDGAYYIADLYVFNVEHLPRLLAEQAITKKPLWEIIVQRRLRLEV